MHFYKINQNIMRIITSIFLLFIVQSTIAQVPTLSVFNTSGKEKIEISQLDVKVEVVGNIATTTYDIVFYNPYDRILEGEFSMPLKDQQEVCRYAIDVNGKLGEGVIVEKVKARQTFEAIVRKNIDPGIITKTKGNAFKTKVYPIPAKGSKRIVLGLTETLKGDAKILKYILAFNTTKTIDNFSLDVKVLKSESKERAKTSFQNIKFDNQDDAYVLNFERKNYTPTQDIKFTIPRFSKKDYQLFTCDFEGETYFYLNAKAENLQQIEKQTPDCIAIYWDNSFSASKRNLDKELRFLNLYLKSLNRDVEVNLVSFNQDVAKNKVFSTSNTQEIITYIKSLKNDGATCFDEIKILEKMDEVLLFSDGVNTIGTENLKTNKAPIFSINSSSGSNYSFLKGLALSTNGAFINLNVHDEKMALQLVTKDSEKFLSCTYDKKEIKEVYPKNPMHISDYIEVSGILLKENAQLKINFGSRKGVTQTKTFTISKQKSNPVVSRIWATKKIAYLNANYQENKETIFDLSQKHTILSKNTSLLVLDRIEDYVAHKIVPPKELKEEYYQLLAQKKNDFPKEKTAQEIKELNDTRFNRLVAWYEKPIVKKSGIKADRMTVIEEIRVVEDSIENDEEIILEEIAEPDGEDVFYEGIPSRVVNGNETKKKRSKNKASIKVLAWIPDAPYMKELRAVEDNQLSALYSHLKEENKNRPSFYIQVADLFFKKEKHQEAIRILSNIIELDLENPELLKVVARKFLDENETDLAVKIYTEIKDLRPEEPQSYRDLALAYTQNKEYQKALDTYGFILSKFWNRFEEIKDVVYNEINSLIALHKASLDLSKIDKKHIKSMPLDIRVTIDWSSNDNDIDLWVTDPNGEKCYYSHNRTSLGGKITSDFTRGYGPEEFSLKDAKRGFYTVYVNYFSDSRQKITGPVTVYAIFTTHYGTSKEKNQRIAIQLESKGKETLQIGQLQFED